MSLRLRRGTDAERQAVTFLEGELVYTTDTKKVFVGDGSTLGGVAIDSALGSIGTLTDVDISGVAIGQVLQWDGSAFVPGSADKESLYGNDSTILVDTISSSINLDGTVKGNIIPDANIAYDLGSTSNRFRDLYLSGTSIDLGGTTISIAGGKVNFGAPVQAEFELNQNMDLKNYYITSTDATPNISIRPGADADFHVATVAGTKKFEVDLDTNTYGTPSGEKSVLQLPVFEAGDYTSHGSDSALGQIVFDDPTKTLKVYNGTSWIAVQGSGGGSGILEGQTYDINITGDIIADDSTTLLDTSSSILNVNEVNSGLVRGNFVGSVFGDDSSTLLDGISKKLTVDTADIDTIEVTNPSLKMSRASKIGVDLVATGTVDMSGQNSDRGEIFFSRNDTGGLTPEAKIAGGRASILMIVDNDTNSFPEANTFIMNNNSGNGGGVVKFGLGIFQPTAKLHVAGNAKLTEELHLGNMTTTERDALTAANGMIIYNTTLNKFQGYENGAWANLI